MDDTSTLELITYALWLARDLLVPALFSGRARPVQQARSAESSRDLGSRTPGHHCNLRSGSGELAAQYPGWTDCDHGHRRRWTDCRCVAKGKTKWWLPHRRSSIQWLTDAHLSPTERPADTSREILLPDTSEGSRRKGCHLSEGRLWDIFDVEDAEQAFVPKSRIDRKHVDFLLCEPRSMQPLVAVELDDSSHNRPDRQERDRFVDEVFRSAELPLVHIRVQRTYDVDTLAERLSPYLNNGRGQEEPVGDVLPASVRVSAEGVPLCPKCGAPMIIRVAQRGQHKGDKFYACSTYPECRGILPIK